ncbi:MAG: hypothetical protein ACK4UT_03395 [Moraxellaceae bacterium]
MNASLFVVILLALIAVAAMADKLIGLADNVDGSPFDVDLEREDPQDPNQER